MWALVGFFVVLLFIGLCFWKLNSDDKEKREHAPNEDEKRNSEENSTKPDAKSLLPWAVNYFLKTNF